MIFTASQIADINRRSEANVRALLLNNDDLGFNVQRNVQDNGLILFNISAFDSSEGGQVRGAIGQNSGLLSVTGGRRALSRAEQAEANRNRSSGGLFKRFVGSVKNTVKQVRPSELQKDLRNIKEAGRPLVRVGAKAVITGTAMYLTAGAASSAIAGAGAAGATGAAATSVGVATTTAGGTTLGSSIVSSALAGQGLTVGFGTVLAPTAVGAGTVLASTGAAAIVASNVAVPGSIAATSAASTTLGTASVVAPATGFAQTILDKGKDIAADQVASAAESVAIGAIARTRTRPEVFDFPGTTITGKLPKTTFVPVFIAMTLAAIGLFAAIRG